MQTIGERIREKRIRNKLTMQDLAEALGKSKGNISEYEKGKYEPSAQTVISLSRLFKVSADWLLTGEEFLKQTDEPSAPFSLSGPEAGLISMFRQLEERDKEDAYEYICFKYNRTIKEKMPLYKEYEQERVAEEISDYNGRTKK